MQENHSFIARQPYIKVIREVGSIEKTETEHERNIYLYENKITTEYREFKLKNVLDLSFKEMAGGGGILYLHTNHSVYSYTVKTSPKDFINICKDYIGRPNKI